MIDPEDLPWEDPAAAVVPSIIRPRPKRKEKRRGAGPPQKHSQATKNRHSGRRFELWLARKLGARCAQALSGDVDIDGGFYVGEAKRCVDKTIAAQLRSGIDQLDKRASHGRDKYLFIGYWRRGWHSGRTQLRVFVIQELAQWQANTLPPYDEPLGR